MNLEESNEIYQKNKKKSAKKQVIIGAIVFCVIIIVLLVFLIMYLKQAEENKFKTYLNGQKLKTNPEIIINEEEKEYVNIELMAKLIGYEYNKGNYEEYNQDENSCYIENDYEIVSFKVDEGQFTKYYKNKKTAETDGNTTNSEVPAETTTNQYIVNAKDGEKEYFIIQNTVKNINGVLSLPLEYVKLAFNSVIEQKEKSLSVNSLDYLVKYGQQVAASKGYKTISSSFENLKAIANNMLVVGNEKGQYGVLSLTSGEVLLSVRYDDLRYIQSRDEFYIYADGNVGITNSDGKVIISPTMYSSLEIFDVDKKLFLAKADGKFGLVDDNGEVILHPDYDAVGISDIDKYNLETKGNANIFFDRYVAIKTGTVYGLYDIETRKEILKPEYKNFGYLTTQKDTTGEANTLLIPESTGIKGIVVQSNEQEPKYGIYNFNVQRLVIPCACSRIYNTTRNGNTEYFMEFEGYKLEMKKYIDEHPEMKQY